jgi:hypothetical protein
MENDEDTGLNLIDEIQSIGKINSIETFSGTLFDQNVSIRMVLFNDPFYFPISKVIIEKEYLAAKLLNNNCSCQLKSQLIYQRYAGSVMLGFCTEKLLLNLEKEVKIRLDKRANFPYIPNEVKQLLFSVVSILSEAQNLGIYHGPVMLQHLVRNNMLELKIVGWGQEFIIENHQKTREGLESHTPEYSKYMCPSSNHQNKFYDNYFDEHIYQKDVYSLIKIIYKLVTGNTLVTPYNKDNALDRKNNVLNEIKAKGFDDSFLGVFEKMMDYEPSKRPNFEDLKGELQLLGYDKISLNSKEIELRVNFLKANCSRQNIDLAF